MDRFSELSVFVAVADAGDFTSAARRLNLTPSGVSKAMTRLEERLGSTLLRRSSKGVRLTREGENFLEAARRALTALHDAESVAKPTPTGTLRISCLPSFAIYQLAPLMPMFQQAYPAIQVEFLLSTEARALLDRQSDVAIVSGSLPDTALVARRFATSRWVACASPQYLAKHGRPQTLQDLEHHVTLNFTQRTQWNAWLASQTVNPDPALRRTYGANHGDMLLALARAGSGIVRLAEYHLSTDLRAGVVEEILAGQINETEEVLYLVYERHKHANTRISVFLDFMQAHFREGAEPWRTALSDKG
ncbi:LysR family transcriptional regulator [Caballeronia sp. J97]|uniref:LysR family transcriptional regulator n=1 Tax=Caballeronia sp. J97 TaxID=2805429 RepID=UPI002AB09539|nr:LysR family transcriptional regulator [Caballeronia sp. J97]